MMRIRLIIAYDGTRYVGWQVQPNGLSIEELIGRELHKLTGARTTLYASGRTDSGVHARAQVAHFDTASRIPPEKFAYALNAGLPGDVRVIYSDRAEGFHARYDVVKKHYRYSVWNAPHGNPFLRDTALHVHAPLDLHAMNEAAAAVVGAHDFSAFKAAGIELKTTVRTIFSSVWGREGSLLWYDVSGSGFMYHMVRILAGTMLEVGAGKRPVDSIAKALLSGERADAGPTAPAHGLTLMRVEYQGFDTEVILGQNEG